MFNNPAKKLGAITKAFTQTLTALDAFIAEQQTARDAAEKKISDLMDQSFALIDIQNKASKVRDKIANLIEE